MVAPQLILLFMTDQFRYDAFQPDITPNLYKLSLQHNATTFTNAYVSTPSCTPARAALLTGKSPWAHGMLGYASTVKCEQYPTTLPSMLEELADYETYSAGKNHFGWGEQDRVITHGYQHMEMYEGGAGRLHQDDYHRYWEDRHPGVDPNNVTCHGLGENEWRACPYGNSAHEEEHPTAWTTRQALHYLENFDFEDDPDKKMFLKVSYHRPHSPYDPPRRLFEKHLNRPIPRRFINNTSWDQMFYQNQTSMKKDDYHGDPGEKEAQHTRAGYLASCEFVDEGVGQIMDWLESHPNNLLEDSLIMWTSDHGDMNGDHNLWRKTYAYEASAHINLVVKLPKDFSAFPHDGNPSSGQIDKPRTSPAIVELRDVAVTLYDLVGILDQVQAKDPLINGKSLLPILSGNRNKVRNWLDLEHSKCYNATIHWNAIVGLYPDNESEEEGEGGEELLWKFIFHVYDGAEQLFCLTNDPNETYNLAPVQKDVLKHFRGLMIAQFQEEERGPEFVQNGQLTVHRPPRTFGKHFPCKHTNNLMQEKEAVSME